MKSEESLPSPPTPAPSLHLSEGSEVSRNYSPSSSALRSWERTLGFQSGRKASAIPCWKSFASSALLVLVLYAAYFRMQQSSLNKHPTLDWLPQYSICAVNQHSWLKKIVKGNDKNTKNICNSSKRLFRLGSCSGLILSNRCRAAETHTIKYTKLLYRHK